MKYNTKIIAMYFTQLHAIQENDDWWGKGFTDWVNVKSARQLLDTHYQPRVPLNSGYYDQAKIETIRWQVGLAKKYGIYGFCHYHYWFDGKQLLETPTNLFLHNTDIDFPFCLSWANETWSKRWDGRDHDILIKQTHPPTEESWSSHFDYLIKAWSDKRAIKIDGKPVFIIYRPQKIEKIESMLAFWNKKAKESGLKGVYYIFQKQYELSDNTCLRSFDAEFQFQPFEAIHSASYSQGAIYKQRIRRLIERLPEVAQSFIWSLWASSKKNYTIHQYDKVWSQIIHNSMKSSAETFPGVFVDWDNTARYGKRATIIGGASPERFKFWFNKLIAGVSNRPDDMNYVFLNAWNEWAECAYLEPDEKYGYEYLEAIKDVMSNPISDNS
ncbi:MAG: glycoside hydrolase family 99-like domain-containing protein [Gammaproteobacteria bacterium]|nr:glycoside hydrolase family 99-like domain-containing protein [Gammaproteobacteria bacterium]